MRNRTQLRRLSKDNRGVIIIVTALLFPVLLAFVGMALDFGYVYDVKRRQQNAADAGAMGGVAEVLRNNPTSASVTRAAREDAQMNGFAHYQLPGGNPDVTVTVNWPYGGNATQVEVIIQEVNVPIYFMEIVKDGLAVVRSRAVAGWTNYADGCIFALNPAESASFKVNGTGDLNTNCDILVNSSDDTAYFQQSGVSGACVPNVGMVGGYSSPPSCAGGTDPNVVQIAHFPDPLSHLTTPTSAGLTDWGAANIKNGDQVVLEPGYYSSFQMTGGEAVMNGGKYYVDGNFTINGGILTSYGYGGSGGTALCVALGATCQGNGVTIYVTGKVTINGNAGSVNLSSPADDSYGGTQGILFWSLNTGKHKAVGNALSNLSGGLYFPYGELAFRGTNDSGAWQMIVADTGEILGTASTTNDFGGYFPGMPDIRTATLLE